MRRGIKTEREAFDLLDPPALPDPSTQFPDLRTAVERISRACREQEEQCPSAAGADPVGGQTDRGDSIAE